MTRVLLGRALLAAAMAAATWVTPTAAHAQKRVIIPDTPACPGCRLTLRKLVTLRDTDSVMLEDRIWLVQDRHGRFFVGPTQRATIAIYDSAGQYVGSFGRAGRGRTAFEAPKPIHVDADDSVRVMDRLRCAVFSPAFQEARLLRQQGDDRVAYDPDAHVYAITGSRVASVTVFDETGRTRWRLETKPAPGEPQHAAFRSVALHEGRVWTARMDRYEIEERRVESPELLVTYERHPAWFPAWPARGAGPWNVAPPVPKLVNLEVDSAGHLWTVSWIADAAWKAAPRATLRLHDLVRYADTMIEVLDPATGRLIVSQRFPEVLLGPYPGGLWYTARRDRDGRHLVDVWRIVLTDEAQASTN